MKFAIFDNNGFPAAFYSPDIHGDNIPTDAIQIRDEQWQEFIDNNGLRKWVDGDVAEYAPQPPRPAPVASVSARQFKLQLLASGLLDQVDAWIATQPRAVQIAYEYSGSFVRTEPMMAVGFAAMGFTEEQIDAIFATANGL